jgi:2-polyprenyl-3-methyl-5-hydroxy-6-metoxy-1,4-benzoquinol methylase
MPTNDEVDVIRRFGERYRVAAPVTIELERAVLGSDYGANGYTALTQAEVLIRVLALRPGERLLDIGSGCGWPGLYLGARTGCEVVVTDLPVHGMRRAQERISSDGLRSASAVVSTARHLPFRAESFDAIVHTDVLCCTRPKLSILRACRRLLRRGGRMAFLTIMSAPNLTRSQHREAVRVGPPAVAARRDYGSMLRTAGFQEIEETDVTDDYLVSVRAWFDQSLLREQELRCLVGDVLFETRQTDKQLQTSGIERGLLRRSLFVAAIGDGRAHRPVHEAAERSA